MDKKRFPYKFIDELMTKLIYMHSTRSITPYYWPILPNNKICIPSIVEHQNINVNYCLTAAVNHHGMFR